MPTHKVFDSSAAISLVELKERASSGGRGDTLRYSTRFSQVEGEGNSPPSTRFNRVEGAGNSSPSTRISRVGGEGKSPLPLLQLIEWEERGNLPSLYLV